jgi:hypothetical protein
MLIFGILKTVVKHSNINSAAGQYCMSIQLLYVSKSKLILSECNDLYFKYCMSIQVLYVSKSKLILSECNDLYFIAIAFIACRY